MSLNRPVHVVAFAIALGMAAYLASALWSAVFIVPLPLEEDVVVAEAEDDDHALPTEFKNTLEELKYYHNLQMRDRNRSWVIGESIVGGLLGLFVFHTIPKWRNTQERRHDAVAFESIVLGVLVVLIAPLVLGWILPPPVKWFPQEIASIREMRENEALARLEALAQELDSERSQGQ